MKFSELEKLADAISARLGEYISVGVTYNRFRSGNMERVYKFYRESGDTIEFKTVQELKSYMENPVEIPEDDGITVDDHEDGILRGAE